MCMNTLHYQEARILITSRCNYRCVFCHGEGIGDMAVDHWQPDEEATLRVVEQVLAAGGKDITLTGGEPLLKPAIVASVIRKVASDAPAATVTVVSNAALLTEDWLKAVAPLRNLRFNISVHTADPERYRQITGQSQFSTCDLLRALELMRKYDVPFKLNAVAMRSLADADHLDSLCRFAQETGARSLKILEMLIMEQSEALFPEYLSLDSVEKRLPGAFALQRVTLRRKEFRAPAYDFTLGLTVIPDDFPTFLRDQHPDMITAAGQ